MLLLWYVQSRDWFINQEVCEVCCILHACIAHFCDGREYRSKRGEGGKMNRLVKMMMMASNTYLKWIQHILLFFIFAS